VTNRIFDLLYGSTPAEFKSSVGLEESITRLRDATKRSVFSALTQQAAVGPVKESCVRLQRVIPMVGNSFKPFFFGRFEVRGAEVYLSGRFSMLPMAKVFMTLWLGFTLFFAAATLLASLTDRSTWFMPLAGIGMFCLGLGFVWAGKQFSKNDAAWLSNVICTALGTPPADRPLASPTSLVPANQAETPSVLRLVAAVLAVIGIVNLVTAYAGPGALHPGHAGTAGAYPYRWPPPALIGAQGVLFLALAVGVYRRKLFAWQLGFACLAASWCVMVWQIFSNQIFGNHSFPGFPDNIWFKLVFSGLGLVVLLMWGLWLYGLKIHFKSGDAP
jgi:hypothetical protein